MIFGASRFSKARGNPLGIGSLFKGAGSKISSTIGNFGKKFINSVGPMFISGKLGQLADKTGITNVIGKDAVKTGMDFVRKGLTGNLA
jgi:hypothetical protein